MVKSCLSRCACPKRTSSWAPAGLWDRPGPTGSRQDPSLHAADWLLRERALALMKARVSTSLCLSLDQNDPSVFSSQTSNPVFFFESRLSRWSKVIQPTRSCPCVCSGSFTLLKFQIQSRMGSACQGDQKEKAKLCDSRGQGSRSTGSWSTDDHFFY